MLHLGVSQVALGSIIWILIYRRMGGTYEENLERFWELLKEAYIEDGVQCRFSFFNASMFHDPARPKSVYPRLKGRGMEVKHVVAPILKIFQRFAHGRPPAARDADDVLILDILRQLVFIQHTFDAHSTAYLLPRADTDKVLAACDKFLAGYARLHNRAKANGDLLWHTIPKCHTFWHMCDRAKYAHPRLGNCCLDEDWVGKVKRIVVASAAGTALHRIPNKVMSKMRWVKSLLHSCD